MNNFYLNYKVKNITMNSFNNLVQTTVGISKPNFTPAETPLIDDLKNSFNSAVQNGVEPEEVVKLVSIMCLVTQGGIAIEDLQTYNNVFIKLCIDSDFSVMDHNIINIVNQINLAKNS
jgi:hypothetical protein